MVARILYGRLRSKLRRTKADQLSEARRRWVIWNCPWWCLACGREFPNRLLAKFFLIGGEAGIYLCPECYLEADREEERGAK